MTKRRSLTEGEKKLWKQVTQKDVPLPPSLRGGKADAAIQPVSFPIAFGKIKESTGSPRHFMARDDGKPLTFGSYANIDRGTAERFRKGEYPIDATLDLHGMRREKAYMALSGFLQAHYEHKSRCLLVITGKGMRKNDDDYERRGILREMFPGWLGEFKSMVLAFDVAKPKHGGSGAFYVLLKRKR